MLVILIQGSEILNAISERKHFYEDTLATLKNKDKYWFKVELELGLGY